MRLLFLNAIIYKLVSGLICLDVNKNIQNVQNLMTPTDPSNLKLATNAIEANPSMNFIDILIQYS